MDAKQHVTIEAKATATDQGAFVALAATYSKDRAGDRIIPGAFAKTIAHWREIGKSIPLHWNHQGEPEDIIGAVDPHAVEETDDGLRVAGKLDLSGAKAKEAWRAMKTGSMSLSFGYMVVREKLAKDANELHELDLFEISVVPGPANADTRFLSMKSVSEMDAGELHAEIQTLQGRLKEIEAALEVTPPADVEVASEQTPEVTHQATDPEATAIEIECINALIN